MRIITPEQRNGRNGIRPPAIPAWYKEWVESHGKWVILRCGCIADINLPNCVSILTAKPEIECPNNLHHGFQRIKKSIRFKDVMAIRHGIVIPDDPDPEGLFPPPF